MSPSERMTRNIHWVCSSCGEVERTADRPLNCGICSGRAANFEVEHELTLAQD